MKKLLLILLPVYCYSQTIITGTVSVLTGNVPTNLNANTVLVVDTPPAGTSPVGRPVPGLYYSRNGKLPETAHPDPLEVQVLPEVLVPQGHQQ